MKKKHNEFWMNVKCALDKAACKTLACFGRSSELDVLNKKNKKYKLIVYTIKIPINPNEVKP